MKADENIKKQFYYKGGKNYYTRFIILISINMSLISRIKNALIYKSHI
jgi:hypothetical protein